MNDAALKKLMLEVLKQANTSILEVARNIDPVTIDDIKTQKRAGDKDQDLFDIDLIVGRLTATTETERTSRSAKPDVEEAFATIKETMGIKASNLPNGAAVITALKKMFLSAQLITDQTADETCAMANLQNETTRIILTKALLDIFHNFNDSAAGFVNEQFVANLLDGEVVPTNTAVPGQMHIRTGEMVENEAGDTVFVQKGAVTTSTLKTNNIADLTLGGDLHGVSLKTKKMAIKGSLTDLLCSLGIKFVNRFPPNKQGVVKEYFYNSERPQKNLSYLLFGKPEQMGLDRAPATVARTGERAAHTFWRIYCWDVDREAVISHMLESEGVTSVSQTEMQTMWDWRKDPSAGTGASAELNEWVGMVGKDTDQILVFTDKAFKDIAKKKELFLFYTSYDYAGLVDSKKGLSGTLEANSYELNIDGSAESVESIANSAGAGIRQTLEDLNSYFGMIHGAVMRYALKPDRKNAKTLKADLESAQEFAIRKINKC